MTVFWTRRRPKAWMKILRISGIVAAAAAAAVGLEMLRRKWGIGFPSVDVARNGRATRVRVSVPARRRRRTAAASRS